MASATGRRQNSSCDPCRRSKKRCAFAPGVQPSMGTACLNCDHLGYKCTFEFVAARAAQKRRQMMSSSTSVPDCPQPLTQGSPDIMTPRPEATESGLAWSADQSTTEHNMRLDDMFWSSFGSDSFLDFNSFLDNSACEWIGVSDKALAAPIMEMQNTVLDPSIPLPVPEDPRPLALSKSQHKGETCGLSGFWSGSPIRLLNSTFLTDQMSKNLSTIYDLMMTGLAKRYLAYDCNQFAGVHRYTILPENSADRLLEEGSNDGPDLTSISDKPTTRPYDTQQSWFDGCYNSEILETDTTNPQTPIDSPRSITLIGVARFLDNFGSLYGNKIERRDRKLDESTLTAVQQAFALQSGPWDQTLSEPRCVQLSEAQSSTFSPMQGSGQTSSSVFISAWFNAHSWLSKTKGNRSFLHLHAVFLFHMTAVPDEAQSKEEYKDSHIKFLDHALQQLQDLLNLVERFCSRLDPRSKYHALLESSIRIMRWYSYVRDTIGSFTANRHCMLEDAPVLIFDAAPLQFHTMLQANFDERVPETSQRASGRLFTLYRQTLRLKDILQKPSGAAEEPIIDENLELLIKLIDNFHAVYGDWLEHCVATFLQLSITSKQSVAFLILFWNLGVLRGVELMKKISNSPHCKRSLSILERAHGYRRRAVLSFASISKRIVDTSVDDTFRLSDSTESRLPLISLHANTGLVVLALVKAIEHTIGYTLSTDEVSSPYIDATKTSALSEETMASIRPLVTCLSHLDRTVSGQYIARPALQDLLLKHTDILMDCWWSDATDI